MSKLKIGVVGFPGNHSSSLLVKAFGERIQYENLIDMEAVSADLLDGKVYVNDFDLTTLDGLVVNVPEFQM